MSSGRKSPDRGATPLDAGRLLQKQNSFTDFIDVTRHLVRDGYADPARVFARGGSAGGLLDGVRYEDEGVLLLEFFQRGFYFGSGDRIEAGSGFIQQDEFWIMHQGNSNTESLFHPLAECFYFTESPLLQSYCFQLV